MSGGAAHAVATSGMAFANTAAIATGSFLKSVGTYTYTGGQTDISISFGAASYNFSKNKLGHLGAEGNSVFENIGYGLGMLTNASDYVDYRSSIKAAERLKMKGVPVSDEQIRQSTKTTGLFNYREYTGPNGTADPELRRFQLDIKTVGVDEFSYYHDVDYYNLGADGITGALLSKRVMSADLALARGAGSMLRNSTLQPFSTEWRWALGITSAFTSIYGFKTAMSFSYLYPWLK